MERLAPITKGLMTGQTEHAGIHIAQLPKSGLIAEYDLVRELRTQLLSLLFYEN